MDAIKDALSAATSSEDFDPKKFAAILHEVAPDAYQTIYQSGHSTATEAKKARLQELENSLAERERKIAEMDGRIKKLGEEKPDISKEISKYELALETSNKRVAQLEKELETERDSRVTTAKTLNARNFLSSVRRSLEEDYGVVSEYADFLIQKPDVASRLQYSDDELDIVGALSADGVTPLSVPSGSRLATVLARELAQGVSKTFIQDRRQRGNHLGNGKDRGKRVWKESEIESLSEREYAEHRDDIRVAMSEGRVLQGQ